MTDKTPITLSKFYMDVMIRAMKEKMNHGKAAYCVLVDVRPDLAEIVKATADMDPYFMTGPADDFNKWDKFARFIETNWYK